MHKSALSWLLAALCVLPPAPVAAQASSDVAPGDPAYSDLAALVAVGLVREIITGQKPYSRTGFARFTREARGNLAGQGALRPKARFLEVLHRLEERFADELAALGEDTGEDVGSSRQGPVPRGLWLVATHADSPERAMRTSYSDSDFIDGLLNPLLQNNQGRVLVDGWTLAAETSVDAALGPALVVRVRPRVWVSGPRTGDVAAGGTLQQAFVRGLLGNLTVDVGRNYIQLGQGRSGGTTLSRNPRGMDQIRLSSAFPFRLPGPFRSWGFLQASATLGDMGSDREFPGAKVVVLEWNWRPVQYFEFGASLLNMQGGEGAPEATFGKRLRNVFLPFSEGGSDEQISEKVAGVHGKITIPSAGLDLYLDLASTDVKRDGLDSFWGEAVWILGARLSGLGADGRLDGWLEGHRTGVRPYTHHQFTSGLTLDGRVIGDPMGPLATGWQMGFDWNGPRQTVSVLGAWERYSGDDYCTCITEGFRWDREFDNPDEIRLRTTVDWTRYPEATGMRTTLRLGYEHVTRFNFTDENRSNFMAQVKVAYVW